MWEEGQQGVRVVLVDDLPDMRRLVEMWLEDSHVAIVGQAADCDEAMPIIARQRPDVVVMDMYMPGHDGAACTAELARLHPEVAVVAFASAEDPSVERAMRRAGAIAYFHKSDLPGLIRYLSSPDLPERLRAHRAAPTER